jgi:hypothetical protein
LQIAALFTGHLIIPPEKANLNGKNGNKQCLVTGFFRRRHGWPFQIK